MEHQADEAGRRRAEFSVVFRRNVLSGLIATTTFTAIYLVVLVIPNPSSWHANTFGQGGFGLFVSVLLAAMLIPLGWAGIYLMFWVLGIPRIKGDFGAPDEHPHNR